VSTTYPIENIGFTPARKYGEVIEPGQTVHFDQSAIMTYSLMEVARDINTIAQKLTSIESLMMQKREEESIAKLRNLREVVDINPIGNALQVETTPWIVRVIQNYRSRRYWRKQFKEARQNVRN
jgi:predicted PilT family ATPase